MAQKYIKIYDDSVLKLSIKQGEESDRFYYKSDDINATNPTITGTLPGAFTMGELAFTRDTHRVFAGNFTDQSDPLYDEEIAVQQTPGGTLVGNKYLGYIDSKPPYNNDSLSAAPLSLTEPTSFTVGDAVVVEEGLLTPNSSFRSYECTIGDTGECKLTEDKKWSRQSYYNSTYDAYDGDYMYDIYRNALILFDHNIKPTAENELPSENTPKSTRRRSKITPINTDINADTPQTVYNHTLDMYGDGYVCIYNVIPDGDTLTFKERAYNNISGISENNNYTQNIIEVKKIYARSIAGAMDPASFNLSESTLNDKTTEKIKLNTTQTLKEIKLAADEGEYLVLPSNLSVGGDINVKFNAFNAAASDKGTYSLNFTRSDDGTFLYADFEDVYTAPQYTLYLGNGLISGNGDNKIIFDSVNLSAKIQIATASSDNSSALISEPFDLNHTESAHNYTSNLIVGFGGNIVGENAYADTYSKAVEKITKYFDNENTKLNYLVESTPILAADIEGDTKKQGEYKFKISPVVYCSKKTNIADIETVGIDTDITITVPAFDYINEEGVSASTKSATQTIKLSELKKTWFYTENSTSIAPENYVKAPGDDAIYISHPINGMMRYYRAKENTNLETFTLSNEIAAKIKVEDNIFKLSIVSPDDVTDYIIDGFIFNPINSSWYENLDEIAIDFNTGIDEDGILTINEYLSDDLGIDECMRLEFKYNVVDLETNETVTKMALINIPVKKYVTKFKPVYETSIDADGVEINIITALSCENSVDSIDNITEISCFTSTLHFNNNSYKETIFTEEKYALNDLNGLSFTDFIEKYVNDSLFDKNSIFQSNNNTRLYALSIKGDEKELYYNFVDNNYYVGPSDEIEEYYFEDEYSNEIEYTVCGSEPVLVDEVIMQTTLKEREYFINSEINIEPYFNAWGFYFDSEDEEHCQGGNFDRESDEYQEWLEQRRLDVMRQFPIIPAHATSVILECKTGENSAVTIKHTGNNKDGIYTDSTFEGVSPTVSGITKPSSLRNKSSWLKEKLLVDMGASSITYVELPLSLDKENNKHFSFKFEGIGETVISLAAYRV